jgi:hypothetical protein
VRMRSWLVLPFQPSDSSGNLTLHRRGFPIEPDSHLPDQPTARRLCRPVRERRMRSSAARKTAAHRMKNGWLGRPQAAMGGN